MSADSGGTFRGRKLCPLSSLSTGRFPFDRLIFHDSFDPWPRRSSGNGKSAFPATAGAAGPGGRGGAPAQEQPTGVIVAGEVPGFVPISAEALRNPAPGDWPMLRRDYSATSFSPLREVTPANAHR